MKYLSGSVNIIGFKYSVGILCQCRSICLEAGGIQDIYAEALEL